MYIAAQILGVVSWVIFLLSYYSKKVNKVLLMQLISSLLDCICYALLNAWSGLLISVFELLKGFGYYKTDKDKFIFILTIPIYLLIAIISNDGLLCIIPIFASLIDSYMIIVSEKAAVVGGIFSNLLWVVYDLVILDYAGVLSDLTLVISNLSIVLYGYKKFLNRKNVHTFMGKYISKNAISNLYKLDKQVYDNQFLWTKDKMFQLYKAEKNSYILIKENSNIIGYINILSVKKEIFKNILDFNKIYDEYEITDIVPFNKKGNYYININSIVLRSEYQNKDSIEKIIREVNKFINIRKKKGYNIIAGYSYAVNAFEKDVLEKMNFTKVKNITNECLLYEKRFS